MASRQICAFGVLAALLFPACGPSGADADGSGGSEGGSEGSESAADTWADKAPIPEGCDGNMCANDLPCDQTSDCPTDFFCYLGCCYPPPPG